MVHSEYSIKSKVRKRFVFEKIVEEYYVKIYKIDYFYKNCKEKITVDNNGQESIPFRIDVYFSECNLALEVDEKGHVDRDLISEKKIQEAQKKDLIVNLSGLILIKKVMMYFMKLVEYKHLLGGVERKKLKELEEEITKLKELILKNDQSHQ